MKQTRRAFVRNGILGTIILGMSSKLKAADISDTEVRVADIHSQAAHDFISCSEVGDNVEFLLDDIESDFSVMHITDTHITVESEDDAEVWEYCKRMHQAYKNTNSHISGKNVSREEAFRLLMEKAKKEKVDLIVLSGDIINFPSKSSVEFVYNELERNGIPYVYISGNHDWHLEGTPGSDDYKRSKMIKVLTPLYKGNNPLYYSKVFNGVNFVCIDDSTYQINKEQLDFFRKQLEKPYPVVLVMHIPLYTSLNNGISTLGNPKWGKAVDNGYEIEGREPWSEKGNSAETKEFYDLVKNNRNIVVLAGHIHSTRFDRESNLFQITTGLSRDGAHRIIRFKHKTTK